MYVNVSILKNIAKYITFVQHESVNIHWLHVLHVFAVTVSCDQINIGRCLDDLFNICGCIFQTILVHKILTV